MHITLRRKKKVEQKKMDKNMKEFHKATFKNFCSAMMIQEHNGAPVPNPSSLRLVPLAG
jgi:hypothetical protein